MRHVCDKLQAYRRPECAREIAAGIAAAPRAGVTSSGAGTLVLWVGVHARP